MSEVGGYVIRRYVLWNVLQKFRVEILGETSACRARRRWEDNISMDCGHIGFIVDRRRSK
jgi:hypothetical protein